MNQCRKSKVKCMRKSSDSLLSKVCPYIFFVSANVLLLYIFFFTSCYSIATQNGRMHHGMYETKKTLLYTVKVFIDD